MKRPVLAIDDPLGQPTNTKPNETRSVKTPAATRKPAQPAKPRVSSTRPATPPLKDGLWREWSEHNRVASFRLPTDLLDELAARVQRLGLPLGTTATAALLHLLDEKDTVITELVDRADENRYFSQRKARRTLAA